MKDLNKGKIQKNNIINNKSNKVINFNEFLQLSKDNSKNNKKSKT